MHDCRVPVLFLDKRVVTDRPTQGTSKSGQAQFLRSLFPLRKGHSPSCPSPPLSSPSHSLFTSPFHYYQHHSDRQSPGTSFTVLSRLRIHQDYQHHINSDSSASTTALVLRDLLFRPHTLRLHQP
ncbi:hypothetical protein VTL71DRAFT_7025 [Oculimacula yallundae]|uniref:Uncharacterized protein n=1 Tax=Oculimacula yallundae TaxID=86028 RepID=A0ABR4BVI9_9HELO